MIGGASFAEVHEALVADDSPAASAWTTVMRVYRSGGLTKDAVYLRGLRRARRPPRRPAARSSLLWLGKCLAARPAPRSATCAVAGAPGPAPCCPATSTTRPRTANLARVAGTADLATLLEETRMRIGFVVNDIETEEGGVHHDAGWRWPP